MRDLVMVAVMLHTCRTIKLSAEGVHSVLCESKSFLVPALGRQPTKQGLPGQNDANYNIKRACLYKSAHSTRRLRLK